MGSHSKHTLLKAAHGRDTQFVRHSFQKALRRWTKSQQERQKLESLLEYVSYCADVLDESKDGGNLPRSLQDLARVEKYVDKIVVPYVTKHACEHTTALSSASSAVTDHGLGRSASSLSVHSDDLPSIIDSDIPSSSMSNALPRPIVLDADHEPTSLSSGDVYSCTPIQWLSTDHLNYPRKTSPPDPHVDDAYWAEHTALKDAYLADLLTTSHAFALYVQNETHPIWMAQIQSILPHVEWACDVLSNDTSRRSFGDLQAVCDIVGAYVTPYKAKADRAAAEYGQGPAQFVQNTSD
ncbi:hypothetical protein DYB35_008284 [Aphanomyces astaci]|uniref:Uncharacterized protein n=2 Tax=Aphanomyces astaci TaxID=112090 RepID=A0A3R7ANW0_APHAT|nr:hypothetical protein DYB35_008284 [Aphanomyces astaci]